MCASPTDKSCPILRGVLFCSGCVLAGGTAPQQALLRYWCPFALGTYVWLLHTCVVRASCIVRCKPLTMVVGELHTPGGTAHHGFRRCTRCSRCSMVELSTQSASWTSTTSATSSECLLSVHSALRRVQRDDHAFCRLSDRQPHGHALALTGLEPVHVGGRVAKTGASDMPENPRCT